MRTFRTVLASCLLLAAIAFGQSDRGAITGTIADPSGAVVAIAKIGLRNIDNGATYTAGATATGNYELPQIPTGNYEFTVTADGFKRYIKQGIFLPVGQTARIDVSLEVGATSDTVTVTETAPLLKTESGEISHNIKIDDLNALPILSIGSNIRSPYASAQLLPGMNWTQTGFQNLRVNGLPSNTQAFRVEGQDSTNGLWQIQASQVQPSVDSIQELAVQTSNFAAEFGQAGGGVFNLTMKSGTNKFHGSAYDYATNEALNAGLAYTSNTAGGKPNEHIRNRGRQHDYGFSLGGPVKIPKVFDGKDKTFFFFNFEQRRTINFVSNGLYTVPTLAMRNGDFSNQGLTAPRTFNPGGGQAAITEGQIFDPTSNLGTFNGFVVRAPFPGNVIPAGQIDPFAKKIQALIPLPNTGGPNAVFNNYAVPTYGVPTVQTIPSVKIDQNLSSLMKLSGYWSTNRIDSPGGDGLLDPISTRTVSQDRTHTIRLNFDYTMKPTLLLHIGAGMVHANSFLGAPTLGDASLVVPNVNNKNYLSYFSALNAGARGGYIGIGANAATTALGPQQLRRFKNEKPSANMSLTWVRNNHTYKAGGEVIVDGYVSAVEAYSNGNFAFSTNETSQPYLQSVSAPFTPGHNFASFLLGAVDSGSTAGVANSRLGNHSLGFFLEDTYKVNRKLTLDYGIRYDFTMYLREQYGRIPAWSPTVLNPKIVSPSGSLLPGGVAYEGNGIAGHCNCDLAKNYPYGLGPRLGVAYQINSKTVFRGGAGVNYGKAPEFGWLGGSINGLINFATSNPYSPKFYLKDGLNVPAVFPSVDPGAFPVSAAGRETPTYVIDPNAGRPARIFTWSIGLQREVSHDIVVEAAYVGNRGAWEQGNISQVNALTAQRAASFGFDIHNAADLTVLAKPIGQALTDPRVKLPYVGFPLTGPVYSALRPFPQFNTNLQMLWSPTGKSWYDSLQAKVSKRFSHGLNLQSAFTWQKELQISAENSYALFGFANGAGTFQNDVTAYDQNKYLSIQSRPFQFVTSASYVTPRWKVNKFVGLVTGDWNLATVLRYQSGAIIQLPSTNNNYNNQIGRGGTLAQRVAGVPVFLQDPNCRCFDPTTTLIVNPAAFQQTPAGQFSNSTPYYNDLRAARFPAESMNFGRNFRLGGADSRMGLSVRAEFTNIFNRRVIPAPLLSTSAGLTSPTNYVNGQLTSGFGFINTSGGVSQTPRAGTLVARFTF